MRKLFVFALLFLLLVGCAVPAEPVSDVNVQVVQGFSLSYQHHVQLSHDRKTESGYETWYIESQDEETCNAILEQIKTCLGHMTTPIADIGTHSSLRRNQPMSVEGFEDAEFYGFLLSNGADIFEVSFLIDGKNTPQACVLYTGSGSSWYTFDDPEAMVEMFWNEELAVK